VKRVLGCLLLVAAFATPVGFANQVVEIKLRGYYYAAPANVRITVAVGEDPTYRTLRIEADGEAMFRSSELDLTAEQGRVHTVEFKNLAAGDYRLRAAVLSADHVVGVAEQHLVVSGP
jgi:hypothetical protein